MDGTCRSCGYHIPKCFAIHCECKEPRKIEKEFRTWNGIVIPEEFIIKDDLNTIFFHMQLKDSDMLKHFIDIYKSNNVPWIIHYRTDKKDTITFQGHSCDLDMIDGKILAGNNILHRLTKLLGKNCCHLTGCSLANFWHTFQLNW